MKKFVFLVVCTLLSGCSLSPKSPLCGKHLYGDKVIYFEQTDRVPKSVLLIPWMSGETNETLVVKGADVIAMMQGIGTLMKEYPNMAKVYSNERMNNAFIQRRMLIRGYSTNELEQVEKIVRVFSESIETWTPKAEN
jgi:hypothetical protein